MSGTKFEVDEFVIECRGALADTDPRAALKAVVEQSVRHGPSLATRVPAAIRDAGGLVHYSPELTVLWIEWPPGMYDPPHDHGTWAVVGVYAGEESSVLY